MDSLTVGYVSGIIAAGIAVAQFVIPNALALILVALLKDQHTAVTWSVVGRTLGNTHWPLFLRSDQTASHNVARPVTLVAWATPLTLICIAVAAIVTPMGLYETIAVTDDITTASFSYIQDLGPLGLGTAPRTGLGLSRACGSDFRPMVCPGGVGSVNITRDESWINATSENWDYRLPEGVARLYQSGLGLQQSTVSSLFDIESRLYSISLNPDRENLSYVTESFRPLGTFLLNNKLQAVEGLVVDAVDPSIGFRNHTAPVDARFGAEWDEDLLFFEPESYCIDTNISLRIEMGSDLFSGKATYLIDNGGYVDMDTENPWDSKNNIFAYNGTQEDPQLEWRARTAAWTFNAYMAFFFNVTKPGDRAAYMNSTRGKSFEVDLNLGAGSTLNQVSLFGKYHTLTTNVPYALQDFITGNVTIFNSTSALGWENPFNISSANFTMLPEFCAGYGTLIDGKANMTNIAVKCGLVIGTSQPIDGEKTLVPRPNTKWVRPIYSCASTTRAVIKTVRFRYNSTDNGLDPINRFEVLEIRDKQYPNPADIPLWGVEQANMSVTALNPLWGLIDPSLSSSTNLSTIRADHLYIPGGKASLDSSSVSPNSLDCIPGVSAPALSWQRVYGSTDGTAGVDYSGNGNIGLYQKWDNLTQSARGTAQMLNFIWMDLASNAMVGTRGHLSTGLLPPNVAPDGGLAKRDNSAANPGQVPVRLYHRAIRYRWVYGIPAFTTALILGIICLGALVALLTGRASPSRVRHYLWRLSPGRIFTLFLYPGVDGGETATAEWTGGVGASEVSLGREVAKPGGENGPEVGGEDEAVTGRTSYQKLAQHEPKEGISGDVRELRRA